MQTINFYIGTLDKDTLKREVSDAQVVAVINACFDNYTIEKITGVYTMQSGEYAGEVITEDTFKVTLLDTENKFNDDIINNVCKFIKNMLNQESVAVEVLRNAVIKFV